MLRLYFPEHLNFPGITTPQTPFLQKKSQGLLLSVFVSRHVFRSKILYATIA